MVRKILFLVLLLFHGVNNPCRGVSTLSSMHIYTFNSMMNSEIVIIADYSRVNITILILMLIIWRSLTCGTWDGGCWRGLVANTGYVWGLHSKCFWKIGLGKFTSMVKVLFSKWEFWECISLALTHKESSTVFVEAYLQHIQTYFKIILENYSAVIVHTNITLP